MWQLKTNTYKQVFNFIWGKRGGGGPQVYKSEVDINLRRPLGIPNKTHIRFSKNVRSSLSVLDCLQEWRVSHHKWPLHHKWFSRFLHPRFQFDHHVPHHILRFQTNLFPWITCETPCMSDSQTMSNRHVWWSNGQTTIFPLVKQCHKPLIFSWWYIPAINIISLETVDPFALTTLESWRIYKLYWPFQPLQSKHRKWRNTICDFFVILIFILCKNFHPTPWLQD